MPKYIPILAGIAAIGLASSAFAQDAIIVAPSAPPPPRVEVVPPAPNAGPQMAWQAGRWNWNGNTWQWEDGHYVAAPQAAAVWHPGHWESRDTGGYVWVNGHWEG